MSRSLVFVKVRSPFLVERAVESLRLGGCGITAAYGARHLQKNIPRGMPFFPLTCVPDFMC